MFVAVKRGEDGPGRTRRPDDLSDWRRKVQSWMSPV